jgi:uncharacterized protein with HEPN domain
MKDDRAYLNYILECIQNIEEYTVGGYAQFINSRLHQDAILRKLQVIAESTQHLSEKFKAKHSEIEWQSIAAFRNVLVHDYLGIDLDEIWKIVQGDLPKLKSEIDKVFYEMKNS